MVGRIRRLAGQRRVGHAGTLDPLAEGVLPVLLGRATRLADFIHSGRKTYRAVVRLGSATNTDDVEGQVVSVSAVPSLSESLVNQTLARFHGRILQTPPRYSALKVAGRRAYAIARAGGDVDLSPRPVTIHELRLLGLEPDELTLEVSCSKGTYIRALARDVAVVLGTVGHLALLVRTRVGPFVLSDSLTLDQIADRDIAAALLPASLAIPDAPSFNADAGQAARLANGQAVPTILRAETVWVYDPLGQLVCLGSAESGMLRPRIAL